jgi:phosphopantothenoylcysteine synthetase/decarboxylase
MRKAVFNYLDRSSVVIKAAAVSDYRTEMVVRRKIKKKKEKTKITRAINMDKKWMRDYNRKRLG